MPGQRLPHLRAIESQPVVFITVCAEHRRPVLATAPVHEILRGVWARSATLYGWVVGCYVVMPDHVHLFARSTIDAKSLADWMRGWKSFSARQIKEVKPAIDGVWQRDYFDRFIRSGESFSEKWEYVRANPVRAGLVADADEWPFAGVIDDVRF